MSVTRRRTRAPGTLRTLVWQMVLVVGLSACPAPQKPALPPSADAGDDQTVARTHVSITLDGRGSHDPEGGTLSYMWRSLALPTGSTIALDDPAIATPTFGADVPGLYVFELTVQSGERVSAPDVTSVRVLDGTYDHDGDGLATGVEDEGGTDPFDDDTDDDGLTDGAEDLNSDGLVDADETDPRLLDSDGDGIQDGTERGLVTGASGTDPTIFIPDADPLTTTDPILPDSDTGGFGDGAEDTNHNGRVDTGEGDPNDWGDDDYDGDGLHNANEVAFGTRFDDADTDDDGLYDGCPSGLATRLCEDKNNNGVFQPAGPDGSINTDADNETDPRLADTDRDGILDGTELGVAFADIGPDTVPHAFRPDSDPTRTTSVLSHLKSSDAASINHGAGIGVIRCADDSVEDINRNGRLDAGETDPSIVGDEDCGDLDGDKIINVREWLLGTDPLDRDSDDDGLPDGVYAVLGEDRDLNGVIGAGETDPTQIDTDRDGLQDGTEGNGSISGGITTGVPASPPILGTDTSTFKPDADTRTTPTSNTSPLVSDYDAGCDRDGIEDTNRNGRLDGGETSPWSLNDDSCYGLVSPTVDVDGDGLDATFESALGTSDNDVDSDDDGIADGAEDANHNGIVDRGETDPASDDTDGDAIQDGTERGVTTGTAGTGAGFVPDADDTTTTLATWVCCSPRTAVTEGTASFTPGCTAVTAASCFVWDRDPRDTDGGGLSDGDEDANRNGLIDVGETDPTWRADDARLADVDGDGIDAATEWRLGTNPLDADSDDDGLTDSCEIDPTCPSAAPALTDPLSWDSDRDGVQDGTELGLTLADVGPDTTLFVAGTSAGFIPDADPTSHTDPLHFDSDGPVNDVIYCALPDGFEDRDRNGRMDVGESDPEDPVDDDLAILWGPLPLGDDDGDGLCNGLEYALGTTADDGDIDDDGLTDLCELLPDCPTSHPSLTDPLQIDSDHDGVQDGAETTTDPRNPDTDGDGVLDAP